MQGAEIRVLRLLSIAILAGVGAPPLYAAQELPRLVAASVSRPPVLDGVGDDPAWRAARPVEVMVEGVMPNTKGSATRARLRAVYTDRDLYLLVTWEDATRDDKAHKPWVWNAGKGAYEEGAEREDMLGVAFELSGPFTGDMLAGVDAVWDVWHWKATRTDPQGYAMDRSHRFSSRQPENKANKHKASDGADTWIARPEDRGNTVEIKQPAPKEYQGDRVPQYLPGTPTDSAADVRAKGAWSNGRWTVELQRRLLTGHDDDTQFEPGRRYKMAISTHDRTGNMDKASEVVELSFAQGLDTARIDALTGLKGVFSEEEGVFKVTLPRSDIKPDVAGVKLVPAQGLGAWAAFQRAGDHVMVMGDIVMRESEVNPVMSVALDSGLEVTALHNHFLWDAPKVMFMHIGGMGEEEQLARAVGRVFAKVRELMHSPPAPPRADIDPARSSFDARAIDAMLGHSGTMAGGVYRVVIGRTARMAGHEVGKEMGVNTWAAFAGSDQMAVVDGDFAMLESEVQPVLKALRGANIDIVAIHNHMIGEQPRYVFLHYWGVGPLADLARGLRAALDTQTGR